MAEAEKLMTQGQEGDEDEFAELLLSLMWDDVMWDLSRYHSKCTQRAMRGGTLSGEG